MKNKSKNNVLVWVVVFLAVLNLTTLATIGFHIFKSKKVQQVENASDDTQNGKMQQYTGRYFRDYLNLDENQMDSFREINWKFRQNARNINIQLIEKKKLMLNEMNETYVDTVLLNNLSNSVGILHTQLKKETYKYYLDIKDLCNSGQQEKLNDLFKEYFINDMGFGQGKGNQFRYGRGQNQSD